MGWARRGLIGLGMALAVLGAAGPGLAQSTAPSAAPAGPQSDPPARVGRLAQTSGTVSFRGPGETQWEAATPNYPVTGGNAVWTEPRSHAAIDIGGGRIYLDSATELDIDRLDGQSVAAQLPQGAAYLRLPDAGPANLYEIDTPRGAVRISQPGDYEIVAGDSDHPTQVTAYQGAAQVQGPGVDMTVPAGRTASITGQNSNGQDSNGQNSFQATSAAAPPPDDLIAFVRGEEQPYAVPSPAATATATYVSPQETGYQDLGRYGSWQQSPDYGPVWIPQVSAGWAPYRYGHWAYVEPWGWTWIDDTPWGFTPFHYGRWAEYGGQWAWVPGAVVAEPVYAPALVSFFGDVGGIGFGAVGWVPLGPGEYYRPWYHCGPRYLGNLNYRTRWAGNVGWDHFRNRRFGTFVGADVMTHSRPVGAAFRGQPQDRLRQAWSHARPLDRGGLLRPTFATARRPAPGPNLAGSQRFQAQRFAAQSHGPGFQNRPLVGAPHLPALSAGQRPGGAFGRPAPGFVQGSRPNLPPLSRGQPGAFAANHRPAQTWQGRNNNFAAGQGLRNRTTPAPFAAMQWQQRPGQNRPIQGGNRGFASQRQWQGSQGVGFNRNTWQGGNRSFAPQQALPRQWQGQPGGGNRNPNRGFAQAAPRQWQGGGNSGGRQGGGQPQHAAHGAPPQWQKKP